jgi:tRNA dimethylallyltransferase
MKMPAPLLTPLVAIVGPTASGKSALGVRLAERLGGEVVACDSTQVYRHFSIGTAKPAFEERRGVPHHLMNLLEPEEIFTAGDYRQRAVATLEDLRGRGRLPILTVGSGLYLRALLEGLADAPTRSEQVRARLGARAKQHGPAYLHRILHRLDAAAAARIAARDAPKLVRAIEVCLLAGKPITEVHRAGRPRLEGFEALKIGLMPRRGELYQRIEQRVHTMLDRGWLEELQALLARGIPATAKPLTFIGYRELRAHLAGEMSLPEAMQAIERATRRYAKRQLTWFRKEPGVHWFAGFGDDAEISGGVLRHLEGQLAATTASRAHAGEGV